MAIFGYIRVSTARQDTENQRYALLDFANNRKLGTVEIITETVSGTVRWDKRELGVLIERFKKSDTLIVTELSRLGRSMLEVMEVLSILSKRGVKVYAIKGQYELTDNIQSKVLAFAFSLAAEVERELISGRTREALSRRKAAGQPLGRPRGSLSKSKLDGREAQIAELLGYGVARSAIARMMGVSRTALLSYIKSRGIGAKAGRQSDSFKTTKTASA
ncbi:recombinase family protein [Trichlorobacter lovleyi]|uniref:Resolvase domain n=1 Tax=Trichlorobacter lovleyi (strain ATCC BAA-1151 / DSM 17278 / SZ) TaxID=398767 RepID=B3E556_TRIL1|nr:recombinase family protein [Trichlorobacter lovleyi]ACD96043.1 Resolvase domain [Trichlorobacter lovleyi SZ]